VRNYLGKFGVLEGIHTWVSSKIWYLQRRVAPSRLGNRRPRVTPVLEALRTDENSALVIALLCQKYSRMASKIPRIRQNRSLRWIGSVGARSLPLDDDTFALPGRLSCTTDLDCSACKRSDGISQIPPLQCNQYSMMGSRLLFASAIERSHQMRGGEKYDK